MPQLVDYDQDEIALANRVHRMSSITLSLPSMASRVEPKLVNS